MLCALPPFTDTVPSHQQATSVHLRHLCSLVSLHLMSSVSMTLPHEHFQPIMLCHAEVAMAGVDQLLPFTFGPGAPRPALP